MTFNAPEFIAQSEQAHDAHRRRCKALPPLQPGERERLVGSVPCR
jgi:hypothetical protein